MFALKNVLKLAIFNGFILTGTNETLIAFWIIVSHESVDKIWYFYQSNSNRVFQNNKTTSIWSLRVQTTAPLSV